MRKPGYKPPVVDSGFTGKSDVNARALSTSVSIPAIGLRASSSPVGIKRGTMQIPSDVSRLGQLSRSAGVGDLIGTTVLAGHVSDRHDRPGAFWRLSAVRKGQIVTVRQGDRTIRYKVDAVEKHSRTKRLPKRLFRTTGAHGLVLISCSDRVSTAGGGFHYRNNVVVTAKRLKN